MKLTKANIKHKAEKVALSLIQYPIEDVEERIQIITREITRDLICTMGIQGAKKTRLQIWRVLQQMKENLKTANFIIKKVNRNLLAEQKRRKDNVSTDNYKM